MMLSGDFAPAPKDVGDLTSEELVDDLIFNATLKTILLERKSSWSNEGKVEVAKAELLRRLGARNIS